MYIACSRVHDEKSPMDLHLLHSLLVQRFGIPGFSQLDRSES